MILRIFDLKSAYFVQDQDGYWYYDEIGWPVTFEICNY